MTSKTDRLRPDNSPGSVQAEPPPFTLPKTGTARFYLGGVLVVGALAGILAFVALSKRNSVRDETATRAAEATAGPMVQTTIATMSGSERTLTVVGETRPYASVTLYAKISGYLGAVDVDKGDVVKKGQLLATIFSPETSREYDAAMADAKNKRTIAARIKQLHQRKLISDQEADQAISDADQSKARLESVGVSKAYEDIRAPFDGTVTARYADQGALVQNATNSQSSALPIVTVSQTERLRVTVYLDQRDAPFVKVGDAVSISQPERPGVKLEAKVTRQAGELDLRTRTLLTEIELPNTKGETIAGSFVDVNLTVKVPPVLQIPVEALVMRGAKSVVPVLTKDGKVHYEDVTIGDNDGTTVNILSGLAAGDVVAINLGNTLAEGQHVRAAAEPKPDGAGKDGSDGKKH